MKRSHKIWLSLFLFPLLVACSDAPMYEKVYSFKNQEWKQDEKMKFVVDIKDTSKIYDFTVLVRTTTDYPYNNLWMFMKSIAPDGTTGREPIQMYITNPDGSWVGTKSGSTVETPLSFKSRKMPMKGKYTFILEQGITDSEVTDILDLILRVDYAKED
ncbi:MAG: gliding motility lipoprotein GldH [bacterium]|nr:gliding motility lipoprotein GldH [bacterium]